MKVAIVTGGSSGMGEATATELEKRGWKVAAMARGATEFRAMWPRTPIAGASRKPCSPNGGASTRSNCAGTTKFVAHTDLEGLSADDILGIFRVNLVGPYQMIRACAKALKDARGCIVNVSSVASILGTGSSIAYAASKAALDTMSFSLARALGPEIRVNIVAPGYVKTPWQVAAHGADGASELERRFAERAPLKAAAAAEDVAEAIVWLIEGARRVTGEIVYVDGGMHIASPR